MAKLKIWSELILKPPLSQEYLTFKIFLLLNISFLALKNFKPFAEVSATKLYQNKVQVDNLN